MLDPNTVKSIFLATAEKPQAERSAFLEQAAGGDAVLRARVEALLKAHDNPGSLLDEAAAKFGATVDLSPAEPLVAERPGTLIGPYKLLEQIGEGGMGVVYMADQQAPVRRRVALKIIKAGMDTGQVIARFEAERQALALMDHPNIARVLDAGATGPENGHPGRPYFVMELVRGVPITEFCYQNNLPIRERLELFVQVCCAVQHAHQKGIIHRDLKPSNVLVTLHDGRAIPKVIDFGVAKATGRQLTEKTLFTAFAQMVGTPLYMSPEQAEMTSVDIDTRSDIYSLGVMLYELLTGTTPFDQARMRAAAFDEVRRIIRDEEPPTPSTRLSDVSRLQSAHRDRAPNDHAEHDGRGASCGPLHISVAAQHSTQHVKLAKLVRGELDWIVMKCLEKERNRRYESASALARDIERHLSDEPVQACPPSKWYRLRKLARRNKGIFAIASAASTVVLLGMITLAASNYLIRQEQTRTKDEKDRAEKAQLLAENRADEIRRGMERLNAANAWLERGRSDVGQRHWDDASAAFTKAVELRPDHVAALLERGDLFALLGLWDLASADFAKAFELREPDATMRWYRHAVLCLSFGDTHGYHQVRTRMRERFRGTENIHFATELLRTCALASDPDDDLELSIELAQNAADANPGSWISLYLLGITQYRAGQHEQAAARLRESLTALPDSSVRALSYPVLAMALHHRGQTIEARQALQNAAEAMDGWMNEIYGHAQGNGWVAHEGVGTSWPIAWWDWVEFQLYYREAKLLIDGTVPSDDPRLHVLRARALAAMQRGPAADVEFAAALNLRPDDAQVRFEAHRSAAYTAVARRDWGRTAAEFTKASELAPDDVKLLHLRAMALLGAGDIEGYRKVCLSALERYEKTADAGLAGDVVYYSILRHDTLPDMTRLLPLARLASPLNSNRPYIMGPALYRAGRYDESVQCLEKAARTSRPRACELTFLAMGHHRLGHPDEARRRLAEAARWIEEANLQTDDHSGTRAVWARWYEPVVIPLLLREAEALLGENAPERS